MTKDKKKEKTDYDGTYKDLFKSKKNFLNFIKTFVNENWVENVSEDNLSIVDKEFITPEFEKRSSDIVYNLSFDDKEIYLYFLLEMQSDVYFEMPFRLLCYMLEILRHIYRNTDVNERARKGFRFPAVVPIVLYNGESDWTAIQQFKKMFKNYEEFGDYLIDFKYILVDIHDYSEEKLLEIANVISAIFYLDHKEEKDVVKKLKKLTDVLKDLSEEEYITIMRWFKNIYIPTLSEDKQKEAREIIENSKPWEVGDMISNFAKQVEEYVEDSKREGRKEGRKEGKKERDIEIAHRLLKLDVEIDKIVEATQLDREKIEEIKKDIKN